MTLESLQQVGQIIIGGISTGAIYALIALGFNIIISTTGILNLAQGEFLMFGAMITVYLVTVLHVPTPVAAVIAIVIVAGVGLVLHRFGIAQLRRFSTEGALILTLGASIFFQGIAMVLWGKDPRSLPAFSGEQPIVLGGIAISTQGLWVIASMLIVAAALWYFFQRTLYGKAMRACSQNAMAASLVGVKIETMALSSFVISGALGALAGIVMAPITFVSYNGGVVLGLKGFVAATLGGLGLYPGALAGGIMLGVVEAVGSGYVSSTYKDAIAFILLILVLLFRPGGLMRAKA